MKHCLFNSVALIAIAAAVCSCDSAGNYASLKGFLSFNMDVDVETKDGTLPTGDVGDYTIIIKDANGVESIRSKYSLLSMPVTLPVGNYTLLIRSTGEEAPKAAFDSPVFGVSAAFSISGAQETRLGTLTCTLQQTMVNVSYDPDFIARVQKDSKTKVTVDAPLEYLLSFNNGDAVCEQRTGYFTVSGDNATMIVEFDGYYNDKKAVMRKTFSNITPASLHNVTFVNNNVSGNASFNVVIDGFIADEELANDIAGLTESVIADDPEAPIGDGGIQLLSTCACDLSQPIAIPPSGQDFVLTMKALVPGGVKKFTVEISSTAQNFVEAVKSINGGSSTLDLVNPSSGAIEVFTTILPFPYSDAVRDKTEIDFDLSDAQTPILAFSGTHSFIMHVTDKSGCRKDIDISMVVE